MFTTRTEIVVAICDEDVLDKILKFEETDVKIKVSKHFYGEKLVEESIAVKLMKVATIGNIFGKDIVELAKKNGFISEENVINVEGVPHAQFIKLSEVR